MEHHGTVLAPADLCQEREIRELRDVVWDESNSFASSFFLAPPAQSWTSTDDQNR